VVKVSTSAPPPTATSPDAPPGAPVDPRRRGADRERPAAEIAGTPDFRFIYDGWFDDVCRWIRALGGSEADRDDIVQEVFLVVRRRLALFDGANPGAWLYRITRRKVRDFRNRTWIKHIFNRRRSNELEQLPSHKDGPAAALEHKQKQRVLEAILARMGTDRRSAFVLFEIDGLSGDEIARLQGIPLNTVWGRLRKARKEFFALAAKFQRAHAHEVTWSRPDDDGARGRRR